MSNIKLAFLAPSTTWDQLVKFWRVGSLRIFMLLKHNAKFYINIIPPFNSLSRPRDEHYVLYPLVY